MQCTFHRSYETVIGSGVWPAYVVTLWSLSVPVHSPEHWKMEDNLPSFPGKYWEHIPYLLLCGTNINEKSFSGDFTEISSLKQSTTGQNQGQCQCTKCSRHGELGSASGRTKAWVQLHSILKLKNYAYSSLHLQGLFFWWAAGSVLFHGRKYMFFPFLGELVLYPAVKSVSSAIAQTS